MSYKTLKNKIIEKCKNKNNVFIYISKEDEVDTIPIVKELLKKNKTIIVPLVKENYNLNLSVLLNIVLS